MRDDQKTEQARLLRKRMTRAEALLWWKLRREELGWKFRRQVPVGPYIIDFACVEARLAIEVDGATHRTVEEIAYDTRRASRLEADGWRVVRFWNREIFDNLQGVAESISRSAEDHARYLAGSSRDAWPPIVSHRFAREPLPPQAGEE